MFKGEPVRIVRFCEGDSQDVLFIFIKFHIMTRIPYTIYGTNSNNNIAK